jgi:hypothetical protein
MRAPEFRIRATIDSASARAKFSAGETAHVRCSHFVNGEAARALYRELRDNECWGLKVCDGQRVMGVRPESYRTCTAKERSAHLALAYTAAQSGFAYIREELWPLSYGWSDAARLHGSATGIGPALTSFAKFAGGPEFAHFLAEVLGVESTVLLRLAAERYRPGQFFGFTKGAPPDAKFGVCWDLTPSWIAEWGGLLEFCDFGGAHVQTYVPRFNSITLYGLWKSRGISCVAPFSRRVRYCLVGYLGAG